MELSRREFTPVQLCPLFRVVATLSDHRFGGAGLAEIDAVLDCPLLLPAAECSTVENFEYLPAILAFILGYILGVISGPAIDALYLLRVCWRRLVVAAERRLTVQRPRGAPPALHG